jgi:hypothetical protein
MKRCLAEGRERFELCVGAAVLANNLMRIAALKATRAGRKRKRPAGRGNKPRRRPPRRTTIAIDARRRADGLSVVVPATR